MPRYPAVALIEYSSIAAGIKAADAMVKRAPISVLRTGTVHDGKYLVFFGGSVAAVEESFAAGCAVGQGWIADRVLLPDVHEQVHDAAVLGVRRTCSEDALGVIETSTVAAAVHAADAGVKGANVQIVEIRLADDIGGKAIALFSGTLEAVEAALEIGRLAHPEFWIQHTLVPRLHVEMARQIDQSTQFGRAFLNRLESGEV